MKISSLWVLKLIILLLILAGLPYLHITTSRLYESVSAKRHLLEKNPDNLIYSSAARAELAKRQLDIQRIKSYVPERNAVAGVVTAMEQEGTKQSVVLKVTDIGEELVTNAAGQPEVASGPIQNVRIKITAVGKPENLVQLLYSVEHMPYLLHLVSWELVYKPQETAQGSQAQAPVDDRLPAATTDAALQADIILATDNSP